MNVEQKLTGEDGGTELLKPVSVEDMDQVIELAKRAYPEKIRGNVIASLLKQQEYMRAGLDNGTRQFKIEIDGKIAGVCGWYKRGDTCPDDVIWGDWFFVDPAKRNTTLAYRMGIELIEKAKLSGYKHMYVETTDNQPDYFNIASYLLRSGFNQKGILFNYFEEGIGLNFFSLDLTT